MVAVPVLLDEYLHTNYDPDVEFVDGSLIEKSPGTQLHGLLQTMVAAFLQHFKAEFQIRVFTEVRLLVNRTTGRHRIPDVMAVETPFKKGRVVVDVPVIVVEIKSPDDTLDDVIDKCLEYAELGVPNIIVLDPDHRRQFVFSGQALTLVSSITLQLSNNVRLPFPANRMFAELDDE